MLHGLYIGGISLCGLGRTRTFASAAPRTRFALVIPARNEEAVIGHLINSLHEQAYPKELYEIIVAPDNCTDDTEDVALAHGATIFNVTGVVTNKGQVLEQVSKFLLTDVRYDAMCVFDADNLVHPAFLQKMNDAYQSGHHIVQGCRDSKNPSDTAVSTCFSISYWLFNRFYSAGKDKLGLSCLVSGTGYMVGLDELGQMGGFKTKTLTEDYEFSAQCVLHGFKVHYNGEAVVYDEEPLTFSQSWKQRRRWNSGSIQSMRIYLGQLLRYAAEHRSWVSMDMALGYMMPVLQFASIIIGGATMLLSLYGMVEYWGVHLLQIAVMVALVLTAIYLLCCFFAVFTIKFCKASLRGKLKGVLFFPLFLLSWLPISIISLFHQQTVWVPIPHTRTVMLKDILDGEQ